MHAILSLDDPDEQWTPDTIEEVATEVSAYFEAAALKTYHVTYALRSPGLQWRQQTATLVVEAATKKAAREKAKGLIAINEPGQFVGIRKVEVQR